MKKISIEIDDNLYQVLLNTSAKFMRSFRKQIVFDLIEVYKDDIAKLPAPIIEHKIEEKPKQIAILKQLSHDDSHCMACGDAVPVAPAIHAANGKLCKNCKVKKYADD